MEAEGCGEELEELSVGGCLMGRDPSRSGTQGHVGSGIAKGSWFRSNEIRLQALRSDPLSQAQRPGAPFPPPPPLPTPSHRPRQRRAQGPHPRLEGQELV